MSKLKVSILQYNISWKDKSSNFLKITTLLSDVKSDLVVLPEMFQTGFCVDDISIAETMEGQSVSFLKKASLEFDLALCGSFLYLENASFFNRFVVVSEGEVVGYYDKVHLFSLGGEHNHISAGGTKVDFVLKGFKFRPIVCYDLRFPYLAYNDTEYDVLLCVANWPSVRIAHWDTLLHARSIENQAYVVGCNRVGEQPASDGSYFYPGHSSAYTPNGKQLVHSHKEEIITFEISKDSVAQIRESLPFLGDRKM